MAPEPDIETAKFLLREHKRGMMGQVRGGAAERKSAEWGEVERYFIGKLKMLSVRIEAGDQGATGNGAQADGS